MDASGIRTLRLPDPIRACLFDLDGVLTDTARVHAAAWKEMFDAYLRDRAPDGRAFRRSTSSATTTPTWTASRATTACATSSPRGGSTCRRDRRTTRPTRETVPGLGNRKNELVQRMIRERGRRAYAGLGALRRAPRATPA